VSIGIYGTTRPSDVSIDDIDVYYSYTPNRETVNNNIFKLNSSEILSYNYLPDVPEERVVDDGNDNNILEGLYNLRLPANVFGQLGIYTIYLKPKRVYATIVDCSVLSSLPSVKGIVLDINELPENLRANNALQGYRIEYVDSSTNNKIRNVVRYVVTSNKVVPVSENVGNTSQKAIRYRFDDTGTLVFVQVTPSSSSDVKPNASPFIGNPDQMILISNTFFSPLVIEVNMVANTIDTLTNYVAGEQIKDVDNGILTYYDENRVITRQFNIYEIKDDVDDAPLYEVKEKRTNIDETQNFEDVTGDVQ
jgi:hypothetical protein